MDKTRIFSITVHITTGEGGSYKNFTVIASGYDEAVIKVGAAIMADQSIRGHNIMEVQECKNVID